MTCQSLQFSLSSSPSTQLIKPLSVFHPHTLSHALFHSAFSHQSSSLCSDTTSMVNVNHLCLSNVIREQESEWENERRSMFSSRAQNLNRVLWEMCDGDAVTQSHPFWGEKHDSLLFFRSSGEALIENGRIKRAQVFMLLIAVSSPAFSHTISVLLSYDGESTF